MGQSVNRQSLFDIISKPSNKLVLILPYNGSHFKDLAIKDTTFYKDYLEEVHHYKIETPILIDLITNSKVADTAFWTKSELTNSTLVKPGQISKEKYQSISRPIFNSLKNYALVAFDNWEDGFITIFKLSATGWTNLGNIERWRY